jgi:hypothetical protein
MAAASLLLGLTSTGVTAESPAMPMAQILRERYQSLEGIKHEPLELAVKARQLCASGKGPESNAKARALGADTLADESDLCPAILARVASEGELLSLYRELLSSLDGSPALVDGLPAAIGAAVMKPAHEVPIGNQRAAVISAALAFDAGFTVAFNKHQAMAPGMPALPVLKPIAERCLGAAEQDLGLCYSTGYVYGARAVNGQALAEPPHS